MIRTSLRSIVRLTGNGQPSAAGERTLIVPSSFTRST
jgi:hypothetical protein